MNRQTVASFCFKHIPSISIFYPQSSQYNFTEILLLIITAIVSSLLVGERGFLIKKKTYG